MMRDQEAAIEKINDLLLPYQPVLRQDFKRYGNHVCRVWKHCSLLDGKYENREKYMLAAVFHDIGIWTDHTFDYIAPSVREARDFLLKTDRREWIEEIVAMINWHHKISAFHGPFAETVEIFRQADWMDVSLGLLSYGISQDQLQLVRKQFPLLGFHRFLLKASARNFLRHPLNPLPMFRR